MSVRVDYDWTKNLGYDRRKASLAGRNFGFFSASNASKLVRASG
jgi:hypothetical protein